MGTVESQEEEQYPTYPNRVYLPMYEQVTSKSWEFVKHDPTCVELVQNVFGVKYILQVFDELLGMGETDQEIILCTNGECCYKEEFCQYHKDAIIPHIKKINLWLDRGASTNPKIDIALLPKLLVLVCDEIRQSRGYWAPFQLIDMSKLDIDFKWEPSSRGYFLT